MENREYNRLIYEGKLKELSEIWNISDLTRYQYCQKYLLEYLLEKNIHNTRMDNYACTNNEWIRIYIKYGIMKPLVNIPLETLLTEYDVLYHRRKENCDLLLDKILAKMNDKEKIQLYHNIKYKWIWIYQNNEDEIIDVFKKYQITIPRTFLKLPRITDHNLIVRGRINTMLDELSKTYSDIDNKVLKTMLEELKRTSKVDYRRTCNDILKLIEFKKDNKSFKVYHENFDITNGAYCSADDCIKTNKFIPGVFNHELSHMLLDTYEEIEDQDIYSQYVKIRKKITKPEKVEKIITYLQDFHKRFVYMSDIFLELYYHQVKKQFGSFDKYFKTIYKEIEELKPEKLILDDKNTEKYIEEDNIKEAVFEICSNECKNYIFICLNIYYREELALENLLDALLKGKIGDREYRIDCLSGHSKKYYREDKFTSFDECLANYDEIRSSSKADIIINKLIELTSEELVDFLDEYLTTARGSKRKSLKRI